MSTSQTSKLIILGTKLTTSQFLLSEFFLYLSQFAVFFMVTTLLSGFLNDEKALTQYLESKINNHTMLELGIAFGCMLAVLGLISLLSTGATKSGSAFLQRIGIEVLHECPRLISATGSTLGGTLAATAIFLANHPDAKAPRPGWWLGMSIFFSIVFFALSGTLSYYLKRHSHINDA